MHILRCDGVEFIKKLYLNQSLTLTFPSTNAAVQRTDAQKTNPHIVRPHSAPTMFPTIALCARALSMTRECARMNGATFMPLMASKTRDPLSSAV